jgi:hypothetical protein
MGVGVGLGVGLGAGEVGSGVEAAADEGGGDGSSMTHADTSDSVASASIALRHVCIASMVAARLGAAGVQRGAYKRVRAAVVP